MLMTLGESISFFLFFPPVIKMNAHGTLNLILVKE